jgi:BirA family biotin operon repressor/biotin-[acetyl-CoA-carboxylase] ligase
MKFSVEWHDRLGSTNAYMKECFARDYPLKNGQVIAAREQTAGRGRQDRQWITAPNTNLCFSLFIETDAALSETASLTMAAALAISETLNTFSIRAAPKWPNDVLVGRAKICGILSERVEHNGRGGIIVGGGLNVNMSSEEAEAIDRPATSMLIESGRAHDPDAVLTALFGPLDYWVDQWKAGGFSALRNVWTERAGPVGKKLCVHDGDIVKYGTLAGFGEHGELLLQTGNGLETIWSGDVT